MPVFFGNAAGGFVLAIIAIGFGLVGVLLSFSPSIRGGIINVLSLILEGIAILVAIAKAIAWAVLTPKPKAVKATFHCLKHDNQRIRLKKGTRLASK